MKIANAYTRIVSEARPTLGADQKLDLQELYLHFGVKPDLYVTSSKKVHDFLIEQMKSELSTVGQPNELSSFEIRKLRNHLALSYFSGDISSPNIMQPLETLFRVGILKEKVLPFESEDAWLQAISLAKDYAIIAPESLGNGISMQVTYCRQYAVSQGINYFRKQGYEVSIEDAKPVVEEADLRKIAESLEEDVKGLGGAWFVKSIFDGNKELYDASMQRVHFARRYEPIPTVENCTPGIPDGYLLNLAVKHSQRPPELLKADERNVALERVIEASRHFAALYDVQNYYQLSVLLQSTNSIVDFVQDTALYDSFFIPIQLRPSDMPDIILGLFSWVNQDNMREKLGFDLDDYVSVIRQILASPRQKIKPTHFHRTNIKLIGGRKAPRDAILAMLSHKPGSMNADYLLPDEYGAETFSERPLVELPSNFFGLPSASWCGAAFYEALFLALLKIEQGVSQRVGDATEELVKARIRSKG